MLVKSPGNHTTKILFIEGCELGFFGFFFFCPCGWDIAYSILHVIVKLKKENKLYFQHRKAVS